ncbi:DDE-type integrase/transposase/recombinase [Thalassococcus sp. CAU 1522]|uniref:DDE-type integrase/transposase/recombinase n=1 Tax=Thalassococcus arenae TaxID=2851652 RepID=A0ABS6NAE6_9RHOB|nr:transposase domain-containing protein [Thalassococcus arenae]MBV2360986.1 DDE-type integrase/transposase/recombinase [Thalassococcus arenae]
MQATSAASFRCLRCAFWSTQRTKKPSAPDALPQPRGSRRKVKLAVADIIGMKGVPDTHMGVRKWLVSKSVDTELCGKRFLFNLSDLPEDVRLAWWHRELDNLHLEPGTRDDAAHEAFMAQPAKARARAERKAAIATLLTALREQGVKEGERFALVREKFGDKGTSTASLKRFQRGVEGVNPINYAPALLDVYKATAQRADMSPEAWRFFLTMIRDAAPDWPLIEAWRRVRDAGRVAGWAVPSYPTFYRRWAALSGAQQLAASFGKDDTAKRLSLPAMRDKTSLLALQEVSLDGRTQDFWVDWGDGKPTRPTLLVLVDAASNTVLDWELAPSENAAATVRLVKRVCQRYGIFDTLYTDNGSAFAGHLVAGGNPHRFRNGAPKGIQPMGLCQIMGIKLRFAMPGNAQAKIAERIFATLSRAVDDGPEFKGAHAGHAPGASPTPKVVPVPVETAKAVLAREIGRHNRETGRRSQGARGRSYDAILRDGLAQREALGRPVRRPTAEQLYLAGLIWKPVAVDRTGRVAANGWHYGGPETQEALIRFHDTGRKILLGRDPDDFSAPAIAFDDNGNLICRGIEPVKRGAYDSADGIREAARNRKAARQAVKAAEDANDYLDGPDYARAMAALDAAAKADDTPPPAPSKVVGGRFGAPLREQAPEPQTEDELSGVIKDFDRAHGFDPGRLVSGQ